MRGLSLSLTLQLNVQSLRQTHFSGCLTDSIHRVRMRLHSAAKASQCIESETSLSEKWQQHNYKPSKLTPRNWASLGPGLTLSRLKLGSNKLSSSQRKLPTDFNPLVDGQFRKAEEVRRRHWRPSSSISTIRT
jgi:hypothetical protein